MNGKHPKLRQEFELPEPPEGFDQACAIRYLDGQWELDFVNHNRFDFASETGNVNIDWPWVDGFSPQEIDWESIGFFTLSG